MLRFLTRALGTLFLLAGFVVGLVDGTRSIAADDLDWTSFGAGLDWVIPQATDSLRNGLSRNIHPFLWDPLLASLMPMPALPMLFILGAVLLVLVRERAPDAIVDPSAYPQSGL